LAILASIANSRTKDLMSAGGHTHAAALTSGFQRAFLVGSGFALVGALLTLVLISSKDSRAHSDSARAEGTVAAPAA
jgi:hypothetical protein